MDMKIISNHGASETCTKRFFDTSFKRDRNNATVYFYRFVTTRVLCPHRESKKNIVENYNILQIVKISIYKAKYPLYYSIPFIVFNGYVGINKHRNIAKHLVARKKTTSLPFSLFF